MEQPSYEEILNRMKEELLRRDANFTALVESDPAIKILEIAAWRELLLRERINEAAQSNLLKFAKGEDLKRLGEFYGVERKNEEEDEQFRKRIKAKIVGWSSVGNYRYHALSADARVEDALVESPSPGSVRISILSTKLSTDKEELLNVVKEHVARDDIRVLTDTVEVVNCTMIPIVIHSKMNAISEEVVGQARKKFIEKFESARSLGWHVTRSWIIANLFIEGVNNVELIEPKEDIAVKGNECAMLENLSIELMSRS